MNINKGMYAEELVNRTNSYYFERGIALIEKRYLPIKIIKTVNTNTIIGKLLAKSYVDYVGVYQGKHLEFEVKQTSSESFSLNLLKPHQLQYLINSYRNQAVAFMIIYFDLYDKFYLLPVEEIINWKNKNKTNNIPYKYIQQKCKEITISFPGIIDFLKFIK